MFAANGVLLSANCLLPTAYCLLNCNLKQGLGGNGTLEATEHVLPPAVKT